jgi:malonyl-CoA O-methyltransferase
VEAARRFDRPERELAARATANQIRREHGLTQWDVPSHDLAAGVAAMLDLGCAEQARAALALPAACLASRGTVPVWPGATWTSTLGLARLANVWCRLGETELADRALRLVLTRQRPDGGFVGSWGRGAAFHPQRDVPPVAAALLAALAARVEAGFAGATGGRLPTIDAEDGRAQAVERWARDLPPQAAIADLGCGAGRYLRHLAAWLRQARLVGVDPSAAAGTALPEGVEARAGGLLRISAADGEFDAVLAIESLEHSLLPERAVRELCRVVRPGGSILIVDKLRCRQALSHHEPWERWFDADEVCRWLAPWCDDVRSEPVTHGDSRRSAGLFVTWTAVRNHRATTALPQLRQMAERQAA